MMRLPPAMDFLLRLVASDSEADATDALSALKIHNYDPRLRDRLEQEPAVQFAHAIEDERPARSAGAFAGHVSLEEALALVD